MKYIVEFEDEPCMYEDEVHFYKCIQAPWYQLSDSVIKRLTPYEPERKQGEWIVWGGMDIPENHGRHICSLCGEFAPVRCEKPLIKEYLSDFCPNCGADMRGGDSNE